MPIIFQTIINIITLTFAVTNALPLPNSDLQELSRISSQPCGIEGSQGYQPSLAMIQAVTNKSNSNSDESLNIFQLSIEIQDAVDKANMTYNAISHWISSLTNQSRDILTNEVKINLQIPLANHSLIAEENSRLHILLQLSNFAFVLKRFENDSAFGDSNVSLNELRLKIVKILCTLRRLLPNVTDDTIKIYAEQDLSGHNLTKELIDQKPGVKRYALCLAVRLMQDIFMRIKVYVEANTVFLY